MNTPTSKVICAWCSRPLADAPLTDRDAPVWHGICATCLASYGGGMFPTQNLYELDETEYDALPFGMLALADDGTVLVYNAAEERLSGLHRSQVVGRNFFTEVAPCTRVREFEGVFRDMVQARAPARHAFDFLFRFQSGERFVHIAIVYDAAMARAVILVQTAQVQDTDVPTTR